MTTGQTSFSDEDHVTRKKAQEQLLNTKWTLNVIVNSCFSKVKNELWNSTWLLKCVIQMYVVLFPEQILSNANQLVLLYKSASIFTSYFAFRCGCNTFITLQRYCTNTWPSFAHS